MKAWEKKKKKAYGKELLNGINRFKLSNYPLDFFFPLRCQLAKGASAVCVKDSDVDGTEHSGSVLVEVSLPSRAEGFPSVRNLGPGNEAVKEAGVSLHEKPHYLRNWTEKMCKHPARKHVLQQQRQK